MQKIINKLKCWFGEHDYEPWTQLDRLMYDANQPGWIGICKRCKHKRYVNR